MSYEYKRKKKRTVWKPIKCREFQNSFLRPLIIPRQKKNQKADSKPIAGADLRRRKKEEGNKQCVKDSRLYPLEALIFGLVWERCPYNIAVGVWVDKYGSFVFPHKLNINRDSLKYR